MLVDPQITEFVSQIDVADVIELTAADFKVSLPDDIEYAPINNTNEKPQVVFLTATNKAEFSVDGIGSVELTPVKGGAELKVKDIICGKKKDIKISGSIVVKNIKILPDINWKKATDILSKPLVLSCRTKVDLTQNIEVEKGKDFKEKDIFDQLDQEDLFVKLAEAHGVVAPQQSHFYAVVKISPLF